MITPTSFDTIAGRLHLPTTTRSHLGVVIVPPHGLEALAAAKTLRLLGERLAAAGHAALRFDLPGTGDSLGDDAQPDRIKTWTSAVIAAAAHLTAVAGVGGIAVVGLRFGALLAHQAAPRIANLAGLILLDPVSQGALYGRELAMTARVVAEGSGLDPDQTATADGIVGGGLFTSRDTIAAMRPLRLSLTSTTPTLVLHRPGARDIAALMAEAPSSNNITAEAASGFERIGLSPTVAETPHAVLARTVAFIDALPRPAAQSVTAAPVARIGDDSMREEALVFGPDHRLFGVLCQPARVSGPSPVLIMVNAGRNPHTGWARSSVTLARRLAAHGIASLRFDLGGIGEGIDRPDARDHLDELLYSDAQDAECRAAIDLVCARGLGPVTVLGACSGAYLALRAAAQDARVAGAVLVNLQRFIWRAGETVTAAIANNYPITTHYVGKLADPSAWKKALTGERKLAPLLKVLLGRAGRRLLPSKAALSDSERARAMMRELTGRGTRIDFVFAEDDNGLIELANHFGPRGRDLVGRPSVHFHFLTDCDHDLTPPAARERLFELVVTAMHAGPKTAADSPADARTDESLVA
ncbi:alpha/beta fold hydrolase [Bradyrhizobium sp. WD16]|uniref:alpha/beta fold hydrolase n=1 Tax=Bradyrhizobium sp. WD16 TaxID=1521768 RepID=UPI0020A2A7B1|nr:alpha/beta fold hydrolase [Bradyrhizobium sp. WD16]UTD26757.1 hypothetical protein DB459_07325 [Bradyrhizobium sp. WD16]